jgi:hypothetical protein
LWLGAAVLVACAGSPGPAGADPFYVQIYEQLHTFGPGTEQVRNFDSTKLPQLTVSDTASIETANALGRADASVSGTAGIGHLEGSAETVHTADPAIAKANIVLSFGDTLHVLGANAGDAVELRATMTFSDQLFATTTDCLASGEQVRTSYTFDAPLTAAFVLTGLHSDCVAPAATSVSQVFTLHVGDTLAVEGSIDVFANDGNTSVHSFDQSTADFFIDVLTAGARIESESGHDFATRSAVPEPAAAALLAGGLALIGWARRRRADGEQRTHQARSTRAA